MAWPPNIIEPGIVIRIVQAGNDRPPGARRTVAKYRESMGILPSRKRKQLF